MVGLFPEVRADDGRIGPGARVVTCGKGGGAKEIVEVLLLQTDVHYMALLFRIYLYILDDPGGEVVECHRWIVQEESMSAYRYIVYRFAVERHPGAGKLHTGHFLEQVCKVVALALVEQSGVDDDGVLYHPDITPLVCDHRLVKHLFFRGKRNRPFIFCRAPRSFGGHEAGIRLIAEHLYVKGIFPSGDRREGRLPGIVGETECADGAVFPVGQIRRRIRHRSARLGIKHLRTEGESLEIPDGRA